MLQKKLEDLTTADVNAELEFIGSPRGPFKRIDHAKNWIIKEIEAGRVKVDEKVLKSYGVKPPANDKKPKAKKAAKEKPDYKYTDKSLNGRTVFTGRGTAEVLGFDPEHRRFLVRIKATGEEASLGEGSVRFKAVDDGYREHYVHDAGVRTESGNVSIYCGDDLSETLKGLTQAELGSLARENGLGDRWEGWTSKNNPGLCRMHLGNVLRRMINAGEEVKFFGRDLSDAKEARERELAKEAEKAKKKK